MTERINTVR